MRVTYKEIKSDILAKIVKNNWGPGNLVPNEVNLAETYKRQDKSVRSDPRDARAWPITRWDDTVLDAK